jgi:hypothetical protein
MASIVVANVGAAELSAIFSVSARLTVNPSRWPAGRLRP